MVNAFSHLRLANHLESRVVESRSVRIIQTLLMAIPALRMVQESCASLMELIVYRSLYVQPIQL